MKFNKIQQGSIIHLLKNQCVTSCILVDHFAGQPGCNQALKLLDKDKIR